jgi:hypothetical protein
MSMMSERVQVARLAGRFAGFSALGIRFPEAASSALVHRLERAGVSRHDVPEGFAVLDAASSGYTLSRRRCLLARLVCEDVAQEVMCETQDETQSEDVNDQDAAPLAPFGA